MPPLIKVGAPAPNATDGLGVTVRGVATPAGPPPLAEPALPADTVVTTAMLLLRRGLTAVAAATPPRAAATLDEPLELPEELDEFAAPAT